MSLDAGIKAIAGEFVDPSIIIDASIPIELSGEDIRRRLCTFIDETGFEWALRPDLTLPVAVDEATRRQEGSASGETYRSYRAPVFRLPAKAGEPVEYQQLGYERFGAANSAQVDAELFTSLAQICLDAGTDLAASHTKFGDLGLFADFVDGLDLDVETASGLKRAFRQEGGVEAYFSAQESQAQSGLSQRMAGMEREDISAFVDEIFNLTGIRPLGLRSQDEIIDRLQAKSNNATGSTLSDAQKKALQDFLAVEGHPDQVLKILAPMGDDLKSDAFSKRLKRFDETYALIGQKLGDSIFENAKFSTSFGRRFAYYDGIVFEVFGAHPTSDIRPFLAGGRYDALLSNLSQGDLNVTALGGILIPHRLNLALEASA